MTTTAIYTTHATGQWFHNNNGVGLPFDNIII